MKEIIKNTKTIDTVSSITNLIFINDEIDNVDVIIIPGSSHIQLIQRAIELYQAGKTKYLLFTGSYNKTIDMIESEWAKKIAMDAGVPETAILIESKSINTKENAIEALSLLEQTGVPYNKIALPAKTYHSRRLQMTFRKYFPNSTLLISSVIDGRDITPNNWMDSPEKIAKILEEIQKICEYYIKGDIAF